MKEFFKGIANMLENLFYSKGKISSKRVYALMIFTNAIVLSYVGGTEEIIRAFLNTGIILAGVIGAEAVLKKSKEGKEDEK